MRDTALDRLFETLECAGEVYEASPRAVPFLLELISKPKVPDRVALLALLDTLAAAELSADPSWVADIQTELRHGVGLFLTLTRDGDPEVRLAVGAILSRLIEDKTVIEVTIAAQIRAEQDHGVFVTLLLVPALLGEPGDLWRSTCESLLFDSDAVRRTAAAMALGLAYRDLAPESALDVLLATLADEDALDVCGAAWQRSPWARSGVVADTAMVAAAFGPAFAAKTVQALDTIVAGTKNTETATACVEAMLWAAFENGPDAPYTAASLTPPQRVVLKRATTTDHVWVDEGRFAAALADSSLPQSRKALAALVEAPVKKRRPSTRPGFGPDAIRRRPSTSSRLQAASGGSAGSRAPSTKGAAQAAPQPAAAPPQKAPRAPVAHDATDTIDSEMPGSDATWHDGVAVDPALLDAPPANVSPARAPSSPKKPAPSPPKQAAPSPPKQAAPSPPKQAAPSPPKKAPAAAKSVAKAGAKPAAKSNKPPVAPMPPPKTSASSKPGTKPKPGTPSSMLEPRPLVLEKKIAVTIAGDTRTFEVHRWAEIVFFEYGRNQKALRRILSSTMSDLEQARAFVEMLDGAHDLVEARMVQGRMHDGDVAGGFQECLKSAYDGDREGTLRWLASHLDDAIAEAKEGYEVSKSVIHVVAGLLRCTGLKLDKRFDPIIVPEPGDGATLEVLKALGSDHAERVVLKHLDDIEGEAQAAGSWQPALADFVKDYATVLSVVKSEIVACALVRLALRSGRWAGAIGMVRRHGDAHPPTADLLSELEDIDLSGIGTVGEMEPYIDAFNL